MKRLNRFFSAILALTVYLATSVAIGDQQSSPLRKQIVLLISISGLTQAVFQGTAEKIARDFYLRFSDDYEVRTIFQADQADLFAALNNPKNVGVFWVSHSGSNPEIAGTNLGGRIVDAKGIEISRIFKKIHPNIKWIGVIGCKAFPIFSSGEMTQTLEDTFLYNTALNTLVFMTTESNRVLAASSLLVSAVDEATNNFNYAYSFLNAHQDRLISKPIQQHADFTLHLHRAPEPDKTEWMNSVQILLNDQVIWVLPISNQAQDVDVKIPWNRKFEKKFFTFVVDSGLVADGKTKTLPHLGDFSISSPELKTLWSLVSVNGMPLGINQHIYK